MGAERFSHLMLIAAAAKNHTTALAGVGNAPLLPPAAASLHGKASHTILSRPRAPYESYSLATPEGEILAALFY